MGTYRGLCRDAEPAWQRRGRFPSHPIPRQSRDQTAPRYHGAIRARTASQMGRCDPLAAWAVLGTGLARRPRGLGARGIGQSGECDRSGARRRVDCDRDGRGSAAVCPGVQYRGIRVFSAGRQCACVSQDGSGTRRADDGAVLDRDPALCRVEDTRIDSLESAMADARGGHW